MYSHDDDDGGRERARIVKCRESAGERKRRNPFASTSTYDVRMYMSKSYMKILVSLYSYSACLRGCVCSIIHDFLLTDGLNYERVFDKRVKNVCRICSRFLLLVGFFRALCRLCMATHETVSSLTSPNPRFNPERESECTDEHTDKSHPLLSLPALIYPCRTAICVVV